MQPLSKLQDIATRHWQRLTLYAVLFVALGALLFFRLPSLTGGYSGTEMATSLLANGWKNIFDAPVYAPFLVAVRMLAYGMDNTMLAARVVAADCGLATVALFYGLTKYWHGERVAVFGTALFGTSAWFLHIARFGSPEILLFGLLALVACYIWLRHTGSQWALLTGFILTALLLYTPGMVWFIVLGAIVQWKTLDRVFRKNLWTVTAGGAVLLLALVPFALSIYHSPDLLKVYAGLPLVGWPGGTDTIRNLASVPGHLFIHGPSDPQIWLARLPILDFFTMSMFFLGTYLYVRHARLGRFWLLTSVCILGVALVGLGGGVTITILMPFIYMIAASGMGFMLDRWTEVFPRNRIAQGVGYGMLGMAVAAVCMYSFRHYYVAWPAAKATRAVYALQPAPPSGTIKQ